MSRPVPENVYEQLATGEEEEEIVNDDLVVSRQSSRVLHTASASLSGGAAVLPPTGVAATPRHNLRQTQRSAVQARLLQDLWRRFRLQIITFITIFIACLLVFGWLMLDACLAVVKYSDRPCDQPLIYLTFITIWVGQVMPRVAKILRQQPWAAGRRARRLIQIIQAFPGWVLVAWGLYMVHNCKTCQKTNPGLFYPTRRFVYGQLVFIPLSTLFFSVGFPWVLGQVAAFIDNARPGCADVIKNLPLIPQDSPDLVDKDTGCHKECAICWDDFASEGEVVRTPCEHYFHRKCLKRWGRNHTDCPLCRADLSVEV